jgi:4-deoxy-L-threo-5-hexosulose-uronate ketol-isomerase
MPTDHVQSSSRHAVDPQAASKMGTDELRRIDGLFQPDRITLNYTHYDRMIIGGALPQSQELPLETIKPVGCAHFLERRELVAVNIGGKGYVTVGGERHELSTCDMIYIGTGNAVSFGSDDAVNPAKFYLLSAPAHHAYPTVLVTQKQANRVDLGSQATSNERSIYQYVHAAGVKSCQLVVGMTELAPGSVWNTMPCHVHDRRMEAYLYFGLQDPGRVFHFLGEPSETRHIVVANEEAVLSPEWSIHAGCGTSNYSFIWAMAGENVDYTDVDPVPTATLR